MGVVCFILYVENMVSCCPPQGFNPEAKTQGGTLAFNFILGSNFISFV